MRRKGSSCRNTTTATYRLKEATANLSGPRSSTHFYAPQTAEDYVSTTMSIVPTDAPSQNVNALTYVPSVVQRITMPSHGHVGLNHTPPTDPFISMTFPSLLHYQNFYDTIIHRPPLLINTDLHNEIYNRIVQPYDPNAFEDLLLQHELTYLYTLLVTNLRNGFPLGAMPSLTETVILENHPSVQQYPDTVQQNLEDEVEAGRMDGPFSQNTITSILRGPFFVSPLIVSVFLCFPSHSLSATAGSWNARQAACLPPSLKIEQINSFSELAHQKI
jgi:hypothetical protein